MNSRVSPRSAISIAAILLAFTTFAQAGPTLSVIPSKSGKRGRCP
jgi:hypothetical protein